MHVATRHAAAPSPFAVPAHDERDFEFARKFGLGSP
jgi:hypothetical protein